MQPNQLFQVIVAGFGFYMISDAIRYIIKGVLFVFGFAASIPSEEIGFLFSYGLVLMLAGVLLIKLSPCISRFLVPGTSL